MDVKFVLVILILTTLEFSNAKSGKDKKKEKEKKGKNPMPTTASVTTDMTNVEEQIAELKKQVASLPKNVVHIHVHDGHDHYHHHHKHGHHGNTSEEKGDDDDHHHHHKQGNHGNTSDSDEKKDDHHRHRHGKDDDDDHHHGENDQHIHMYMHVEGDCHNHDKNEQDEEIIHAHCEVEANSNLQDGEDITGQIHMVQKVSNRFIWNRHVGDLGNIENDINGEVDHKMTDDKISLRGKYSLIGRSISIHAGPDDLGLGGSPASEISGNAGAKIACCIIARGNPELHYQSSKTTTVKPVVTDGGK